MSIRDRVTVHTKDGKIHSIMVSKQGGEIIQSLPARGNPWFGAVILDKSGRQSEKILVAESEISAVVEDTMSLEEARKAKK